MAAPRCSRALLGPAKRVNLSTPTSCARSFSHSTQLRDDANNGSKTTGPLAEELEKMGINPDEYKMLWKSHQLAERRSKKREPKSKEESEKRWKELQDSPDHNTLLHAYKRAGIEPIKLAKKMGIELPGGEKPKLDVKTEKELDALRDPLNVRAIHLRPLRRTPTHGIPVCDLQLRTYSIRNLEFFADFAMRAAYFLNLPARGPIPLPRITERWTVPRSNFIFKKSQENFERITMRRLIQIQDGHPDVVKAWLAFLQEHQFHGVGMKANIWEHESLEDALSVGSDIKEGSYEGRRESPMLEKVNEILASKGFKEAMAGHKVPEVESRP
ncbi:ribosomal protein S10 [Aaosphaeria arxii CBS 175.79]|uniref:Small ribosomal subunit protein uS10m n=1 Tax=Aaosphaeria arxii CBS 175.79 TaxID=1450172 RepID=A0A6A5XIL5_9PLEO|nr:ribosomal protein S10 [Aaosphaeria arxii CBS 175.79]KAF2012667.1 ribosomal protein S10 [Aaosphaeria arxii CBS 175.79]